MPDPKKMFDSYYPTCPVPSNNSKNNNSLWHIWDWATMVFYFKQHLLSGVAGNTVK
jgi:hypothetical protein